VVGVTQRGKADGTRFVVVGGDPVAGGRSDGGQRARVDRERGVMTLKDTQGAELTVQANSPKVAATVAPGTRVLADVVSPTRLASGQALR